MIETEEERYYLDMILLWGYETIYCYFNNKPPYNCLAKSITIPANADTNGVIWVCDDCKEKLRKRVKNETFN